MKNTAPTRPLLPTPPLHKRLLISCTYFGSTCTPAAMNRTQRGDGSASNTAAPSTTGGRQAAPTPQAVGAGADVAARRRGGSRSVTSTRPGARSQSTPPRAPPRPGQARAPPGPTPLPVPGPVVMPPASKGATTRQTTSRGQLAPGVVEPERAPKYASSASGTVTGSPSPPAPGPELRRSTRQAASGSKPGVQPLPAPSPKAAPNPGPAASPTGSGNSAVPTGKPTSVRSSTTASAQDPSLAGSKPLNLRALLLSRPKVAPPAQGPKPPRPPSLVHQAKLPSFVSALASQLGRVGGVDVVVDAESLFRQAFMQQDTGKSRRAVNVPHHSSSTVGITSQDAMYVLW